ncbi:hypothetical protein NL676_037185 [Syzygium grande]|nr:hypothetical protein NL676_037185 [Syzygium grande]
MGVLMPIISSLSRLFVTNRRVAADDHSYSVAAQGSSLPPPLAPCDGGLRRHLPSRPEPTIRPGVVVAASASSAARETGPFLSLPSSLLPRSVASSTAPAAQRQEPASPPYFAAPPVSRPPRATNQTPHLLPAFLPQLGPKAAESPLPPADHDV